MLPPRDDFSDTEDFFEMSLDHLCVAGYDGYFKRVNRSWMRTLGWTVEELTSKPLIDLVHPDDRETTLAGRSLLHVGADMGPLRNRYRCRDGSYRWFEWRSIAHPDRGVVYAAARDITEQKLADERTKLAQEREEKLQRQLTFTDRMASIGTLAGGVAHEINNPLGVVTANIEMIIEEIDYPTAISSELRAMAVDIQTGAERIRKIVGKLKTFSRDEEECRAVVELRPILEQAIDMTLNEIRHRGQLVRNYGDTPCVDVDEARLGQVLINLLRNAVQALPEGDCNANEIRITTSTDPEGRAVIEVRDTGTGIPESMIGRIFDPFFTTKAIGVGTGLGLSICHTLVTGMGGEISATSEAGRGTTMRVVLLPAKSRTRHAEAPVGESAQPAALGAAILVVDDEPQTGAALRRILREHHVTVVSAAKSALDLLESGGNFDLIFSDVMMPEISGLPFLDELVRRFPDAAERVVFMSGGAFTPAAVAFLDRIGNETIDKPFAPMKVRELVQRLLRRIP